MSKKSLNVIFLIAIAAMVLVPLFRSFSPVDESTATMEKRDIVQLPSFKIGKLDRFNKKFNEFFNDHLGFRKYIIQMNSHIKVNWLKVSSMPQRVALGKEGWLFHNDNYYCEEFFMNVRPFTNSELEELGENIWKRKRFCDKRGIDYYLFMIPSKHHVYPEYMPDNFIRKDTVSRLKQFTDHIQLKYDFRVYTFLDTMIETKGDLQYYLDKDTHWNMYGAAFSYSIVMSELMKKYPELNVLDCMNWERETRELKSLGDLSGILGKYDDKVSNHVVVVPPKDFKYNYEEIEAGDFSESFTFLGPPRRFITSNKHLPKAIILRDSFSDYLIKFLATGFSESLFLWTHQFTPEAIQKEKPQIVIELMAERNLDYFDKL